MRALWIAAFASAVAIIAVGCDGSACEGDCQCAGTDCVCPSSGNCLIDCAAECDLQCAGSGNCDFVCGPACATACTGSGECIVDVGDLSTVSCTGSGNCEVNCHGDCTVSCPGSGACLIRCDLGFACTMDRCDSGAVECPDSVLICGGVCP